MGGASVAYLEGVDVKDKVYVITGANVGLGLECAKALYVKGAKVVMACRDEQKAGAAIKEIEKLGKGGEVRYVYLDLADLGTIKQCVEQLGDHIDGLMNNAGVMMCPKLCTAQGHEMQIGTNHFGHFAFTLAALPLLEASSEPEPRIVTVSSLAAGSGSVRFDDLASSESYNPGKAYAQSKLCNLMFAFELDKRLKATGSKVISVAAHPGVSATDLTRHLTGTPLGPLSSILLFLVATSPRQGCLSQLHALVRPDVKRSSYWGPAGGWRFTSGWWGRPHSCIPPKRALNTSRNERLWRESESVTGFAFPANPASKL